VLLFDIEGPIGVGQAAAQLVADGLGRGERGKPVLDVRVELPHQFGQIGPGLAGGGGKFPQLLGNGLNGGLRALLREGLQDVLQGGLPSFLARAAGLFQLHGGLGCVRELPGREGLSAPGHDGLLGDQAGRQGLASRLGRVRGVELLEDAEGRLEGVGCLDRAGVREQLGLIAEGLGEAGAVGGLVDVQSLGEFGDDRLDLDAELTPAALNLQRQRVIDAIGHADHLAGRPVRPVPAAHLRDRPAQPQRGQHVVSVVGVGHGLPFRARRRGVAVDACGLRCSVLVR